MNRDLQAEGLQTRRNDRLPPILIPVVCVVAYAGSLSGDFCFDDRMFIAGESLDGFSPDNRMLHRPVMHLTIAANLWLSGSEPWGFHILNILIHTCAALLLYFVGRIIVQQNVTAAPATRIAMVVAMIWAVHPLTTEAVTYIIQRCESLMGMFYLATLLFHANGVLHNKHRWFAAAVLSFWVGAGCKEPIWLAPLMLVFFEWLVLRQDIMQVLGRWKIYGAYVAPALVLLFYVVPQTLRSGGTVGTATGMTPWSYLLTQSEVIAHYLWLSMWPRQLCFDYGWRLADSISDVLPGGLVTVLVFLATVWLTVRRDWRAFAGIWFFLVLAPTSSLMPIRDIAVEHRMYLPLISVVAVMVGVLSFFAEFLSRHVPLRSSVIFNSLAACIILILGTQTHLRNQDYTDERTLWKSAISVVPTNPRPWYNLGLLYDRDGDLPRAEECLSEAVRLRPGAPDAHVALAAVQSDLGKFAEAHAHLVAALQINPRHSKAVCNLGVLAAIRGDPDAARRLFLESLEIQPQNNQATEFLKRIQEETRLRQEAQTRAQSGGL